LVTGLWYRIGWGFGCFDPVTYYQGSLSNFILLELDIDVFDYENFFVVPGRYK
jgi:hypothetical protein